jgi:hypothetical protein
MATHSYWWTGHSRDAVIALALALALAVLMQPAPAGAQTASPGVHAPAAPQGMTGSPLGRLAEPTLPAQPAQADLGAQTFWLHCMVCHGDRGQGLTDEFRAAWPKVDQNCWQAHCHATSPAPGRSVVPRQIPAVIGPSALAGFATAADLHQFIASKMPYQAPGTLDDRSYWQLTAYLARANGADPGPRVLDGATAGAVSLHPASPQPDLRLLALAVAVGLLGFGMLLAVRRRAAARSPRA